MEETCGDRPSAGMTRIRFDGSAPGPASHRQGALSARFPADSPRRPEVSELL